MYADSIDAVIRCPETETAFSLSAGPMSAVAAVGAGFVLTAIIQLLGQRRREELLGASNPKMDIRSTVSVTISFFRRKPSRRPRKEILEQYRRREEKRSTALTLLYSTLVVLSLDGFLFALVGGQERCIKANAEAMIASGVMAVGATSFFCAMAWLLDFYEDHDVSLARLSRFVAYFFPFSVVCLLGITAEALVSDYYEFYKESGLQKPLPFKYLMIYVPLGMIGIAIRWFLRRDTEPKWDAVTSASRLAVGYAILSLLLLGAAAAIPFSVWASPFVEWTFLLFFVLAPIVISTIIIFALLGAMPAGRKAELRGSDKSVGP